MVLELKRAESNYNADLLKIRVAVRTRLGIVAGVVIVGIFQVNYEGQPLLQAVAPLLGIAAFGVLAVFAFAARDKKRAQEVYDSSRLHVPSRKTGR